MIHNIYTSMSISFHLLPRWFIGLYLVSDWMSNDGFGGGGGGGGEVLTFITIFTGRLPTCRIYQMLIYPSAWQFAYVDHSTDVKQFINSMKTICNDGAFFNYFKRLRSLADDHCIIHSVISCLCAKYDTFESSVNDLLCKLKNECYENIYEYMPFFDGDYNSFFNMHEYVDVKSYNTSFCDLVPFMMSNILNEVIVIIDKNIYDTFVTVLSPRNSRTV